MEKTEIKNGSEIYDTVRELLRLFGADSVQTVEFTDSSHGDSDIRHNYLIDRKYVLRINSAPVMTDRRLEELNRLIERYREFGMHAPKFLKAKDGRFIVERDGICPCREIGAGKRKHPPRIKIVLQRTSALRFPGRREFLQPVRGRKPSNFGTV